MPSTRRRQCNGGSRWSCLQAKAPHFFKIIHSAIVEKRKLGIPKKFVRKYGKNLSNLVFLKVPSGAIWRVELIKLDGEVWLQSGWQEFAEYYSIGYGHFLVFRYEGNSRFHVLIFDMRASEIEYPFNNCPGEEANLNAEFKVPKIEESENDVSVEILDDFLVSQKRKEKTPLQYHRPREMTRTNSTCKVENTFNLVPHSRSKSIQTNGMKLAELKTHIDSQCPGQGFSDGLNLPTKEYNGGIPASQRRLQSMTPKRRQPFTANEKVGALERAKAFKSENPFFVVTMQPSYVIFRYNLSIPLIFVKRYFTEKCNNVILRVSDGRTWSVKCRLGTYNLKLYSGWRAFVEDNYLKLGDVCVFELIKEIENSLKVVIFRVECPFNANHGEEASLKAEFKVPKMEESENDDSVEILDDFPLSQKRKEKSPLQHHRPCEMTRTNSTCKVENTFNLVSHSRSKSVQTNDVLNFPAKECGGCMPDTRRHVQFMIPERKRPVTSDEKVGAFERAKGFKSENRFFMVLMQPSYVQSNYILNIPLVFVKKYFTEKHNNVILRVSDGRTWSVKCCLGTVNAKLGSGWRIFVRDNNLKVGDVCVFELIKEIENSMKVVIFRVTDDSTR